MKFNKFQNSIIKRANVLSKHGYHPRMTMAGNKFISMAIPVIREGRKALHYLDFTKTSKTTISAKCYYEFSDDRSTSIAPIPVEMEGKMHQVGNSEGIYKLTF